MIEYFREWYSSSTTMVNEKTENKCTLTILDTTKVERMSRLEHPSIYQNGFIGRKDLRSHKPKTVTSRYGCLFAVILFDIITDCEGRHSYNSCHLLSIRRTRVINEGKSIGSSKAETNSFVYSVLL